MASQNEQANITVNLDIADSEKKLRELKSELAGLTAQKKSALNKDEKNALSTQIKETREKVAELKSELRQKVDIIIDGKAAGASIANLERAARQLKDTIKKDLIPGTEEYNKAIQKYLSLSEKVAAENKKLTPKKGEGFLGKAGEIAAGLGLAVSIDKVIEFGKESFKAFTEAEKNVKQLQSAVKDIANGSSGAVDILIDQSEKLQKTTIFSDDDIQRAQTSLLQFGLSVSQTAALIPKLTDLASARNISLADSVDVATKGINGQMRGLKNLGIEFISTGDKTKDYALLLQQLERYQGQATVAVDTTAGALAKQANELDDLQEKIGENLAPAVTAASKAFLYFLEGVNMAIDGVEKLYQVTRAFFDGDYKKQLEVENKKRESQERIKRFQEGDLKDIETMTTLQKQKRLEELEFDLSYFTEKRKLGEKFTQSESEQIISLVNSIKMARELIASDKTKIKDPDSPDTGTGGLNKKSVDDAKKVADQTADLLRKLRDLRIELMNDGAAKEEAILQGQYEDEVMRINQMKANENEKSFALILLEEVTEKKRQQIRKKYADEAEKTAKDLAQAMVKGVADELEQHEEDIKKAAMILMDAFLPVVKDKSEDAAKAFEQSFKNAIEGVSTALDALSQGVAGFATINANKSQAAYNKEQDLSNKRKEMLKRELDAKRISQEKYEQAVAGIDKKMTEEDKKRQLAEFERSQKTARVQAIISTALSVARALSQPPGPPATIPFGILAAALGGIQLATINSTPPPALAAGGFLGPDQLHQVNGPSHKQGGIDLVNKQTGQVIANMEGGEGVFVTSKQTTPGVKSVLDAAVPKFNGSAFVRPFNPVNTVSTVSAIRMAQGGFLDVNARPLANRGFDPDINNGSDEGKIRLARPLANRGGLDIEYLKLIATHLERVSTQLANQKVDPFAAYRNFEKVQNKVLGIRNGSVPVD